MHMQAVCWHNPVHFLPLYAKPAVMDNASLYKAFKHILFMGADHTYFNARLSRKLTSVTTYKKRWEHEFDDSWADKKAAEYGTKGDRVRDFWKWESRVALSKGTALHAFLEALFQRKYIIPAFPPDVRKEDMDKLLDMAKAYFKSVEEPVVALEFVLGNDFVGGTVDKLLQGKEGLVLRDYKTGKVKGGYGKLKAPYQHLEDSSLSKYTLQLNCYRDILENHGFPVERMEIVWFNEEEDNYRIFNIERLDIQWD